MTYLPAAPWWNMLRRIKEPRELVDQCPHIVGKKMSPPLVKECIQGHTPSYAAAAKSLQSCLTLCDPRDGSPPGSPIPGILQARTLEWVAISFSNAQKWKVKVKSLSRVGLLATPWTAAHQAPPSMGFSRQKSTGAGCHYLLLPKVDSYLILFFKCTFCLLKSTSAPSFEHCLKRMCHLAGNWHEGESTE